MVRSRPGDDTLDARITRRLEASGSVGGDDENSISLVFSSKVQVRLDSQSSEAERLKRIHKMPSA